MPVCARIIFGEPVSARIVFLNPVTARINLGMLAIADYFVDAASRPNY
jgi:hypothetical protein